LNSNLVVTRKPVLAKLLTLTKNGHRFLTHTQSAGNGQAFYYGFTNSREVRHDADLYRLYQKGALKIEGYGADTFVSFSTTN
jgi:hypothetical protein